MNIITTPIFYLILILPLLYFGKKKSNAPKQCIILFVVYVILDMFVTALPVEFHYFDFIKLEMNWSGKIYSYILAISFIFLFKSISLSEFGITTKQKEGSTYFSVWTSVTFLVVMLVYCIFIGRYKANIENIIFQITMPSLIEEIVYRGILLTLLSMVFVNDMKIGEINFGMGVIITSILFGLWHGLNITDNLEVTINWILFVYTGLIGFVLALVKERTGSLLFPIIIHQLINILPQTMGYIF